MATIDLGKIKFNWRGTYAGGTAYVPDDVVYYMDGSVGSSYMCVANTTCLLYTSPSPRDRQKSRMPSSA